MDDSSNERDASSDASSVAAMLVEPKLTETNTAAIKTNMFV